MRKLSLVPLVICFLTVASNSSPFAGWDPGRVERKQKEAEVTIARFIQADPSMKRFFDNAHGYAVFPTVGKGAFIIGGAHGSGLVYDKREIIGTVTLTQVTVGLQAGGQSYSQIIFFYDKVALDNLKNNDLKFAAQASAIAVTAGASTDVDYEGGVAVFTMGQGGLMLEASIGGQQFQFESYP
jgi:lipid-binding SYLF domain-containing protein